MDASGGSGGLLHFYDPTSIGAPFILIWPKRGKKCIHDMADFNTGIFNESHTPKGRYICFLGLKGSKSYFDNFVGNI